MITILNLSPSLHYIPLSKLLFNSLREEVLPQLSTMITCKVSSTLNSAEFGNAISDNIRQQLVFHFTPPTPLHPSDESSLPTSMITGGDDSDHQSSWQLCSSWRADGASTIPSCLYSTYLPPLSTYPRFYLPSRLRSAPSFLGRPCLSKTLLLNISTFFSKTVIRLIDITMNALSTLIRLPLSNRQSLDFPKLT